MFQFFCTFYDLNTDHSHIISKFIISDSYEAALEEALKIKDLLLLSMTLCTYCIKQG